MFDVCQAETMCERFVNDERDARPIGATLGKTGGVY